MRKYLWISATVLFVLFGTCTIIPTAGAAPLLDLGVKELGISGDFDFDGVDGDIDWNLFGTFGYFVQQNLELGLRVNMGQFANIDTFGAGAFAEYNIPVSDLVVPYGGISLDWQYADIEIDDDEDSQDAFVVSPRLGIKWFLRDYFAIDTNVFYAWASEDIYLNDREFEDDDWGAMIGLRVFFQ